MEHELLFSNPVFHEGVNVTVRKGDKWMKANVGDTLIIKDVGKNQQVAKGTLVGQAYLPLLLIPESWLAFEHDPGCRNRAGLFAELKRVYPDFTKDSWVTVLLFNLQRTDVHA